MRKTIEATRWVGYWAPETHRG